MTYAINGTSGNDTINGTSNDDTIFAKAGNDVVNAGSGNDYVDAGSGNDTVNAGNGNDEVYGGDGNDVINGEAGNDELHGGSGNDTIDGGTGNDLLDGGDGDDVLKGNVGCDIILGGDGNDTINAGGGNDLIYGGQGTDTAIFAGSYASYNIVNLFGLLFINGQDGTDLALDVEFLKFDNGTYNVATHAFTPNQPPAPTLSISDASANEEAGTITFTVTLSAPATSNVTFNYAPPMAAPARATMSARERHRDHPRRQTTATITIALTNDKIVEPGGETFLLNLSNPVGATIADGQATGTIIEQDQLINGTPGNDGTTAAPLSGGPGDDTINGLAGDDHLAGNGGDDHAERRCRPRPPDRRRRQRHAQRRRRLRPRGLHQRDRGITVDLGAGTVTGGASVGNDTLNGIEGLKGTALRRHLQRQHLLAHQHERRRCRLSSCPAASACRAASTSSKVLVAADIITGNGNTRISYQSATGR
jgi:Ca2+-binding RTX toxin-like protein